jgi:hypothetical protein
VFRGAQHDKEKSLLFWGVSIVEDREAKRESYGGPPRETGGRLRGWNQVFRGAQHDNEKSLRFWGLSIVEDGAADFGGNRSLRIGRFEGGL